MAMAIDEMALLRTACESILAHHIKARLVQTGARLVRGDADGHARWIVGKWRDREVRLFYFLSTTKSEIVASRVYAKAAGYEDAKVARKFIASLRSKKVARYRIRVRLHDTTQEEMVALFRQGRELFYSNAGVKLEVGSKLLDFSLAQQVTSDTLPIYSIVRANHEGAVAAQEADTTRSDAERSDARKRLEAEERSQSGHEKKQAELFAIVGGR